MGKSGVLDHTSGNISEMRIEIAVVTMKGL